MMEESRQFLYPIKLCQCALLGFNKNGRMAQIVWLILIIKIKLTKSENDYRQERMEDYPLEHKFDIGTMDLESKS